jgi:hypothetical protein
MVEIGQIALILALLAYISFWFIMPIFIRKTLNLLKVKIAQSRK